MSKYFDYLNIWPLGCSVKPLIIQLLIDIALFWSRASGLVHLTKSISRLYVLRNHPALKSTTVKSIKTTVFRIKEDIKWKLASLFLVFVQGSYPILLTGFSPAGLFPFPALFGGCHIPVAGIQIIAQLRFEISSHILSSVPGLCLVLSGLSALLVLAQKKLMDRNLPCLSRSNK